MDISKIKNESHNIYFGRRDNFYYVEVTTTQIDRDNKISELFGESPKRRYISMTTPTSSLYLAKFWKDRSAVERFVTGRTGTKIIDCSRDEFINSIPCDGGEFAKDPRFLKNLQMKAHELKYQKKWKEFRKTKYKCIDAYTKVQNPNLWLPCPKCNLIPLVWSYNNGNSTGCGCGENEYRHFSIHAESILSYVTRNSGSALFYDSDKLRKNWNHWVRTGEILDSFEELKSKGQW